MRHSDSGTVGHRSGVGARLLASEQVRDDAAALRGIAEFAGLAVAERRVRTVEPLTHPPRGLEPFGVSRLLDHGLHLADELRESHNALALIGRQALLGPRLSFGGAARQPDGLIDPLLRDAHGRAEPDDETGRNAAAHYLDALERGSTKNPLGGVVDAAEPNVGSAPARGATLGGGGGHYVGELRQWAVATNTTVCLFEAFDEPWKGDPDNPLNAEKHWGLFNVDRTAKKAMN